MKKDQVLESVMEIISKTTDIPMDELSAEKEMMDDLDMSSLEIMTMISSVEKAFKLRISSDALRDFVTIEDIADFLMGAIR